MLSNNINANQYKVADEYVRKDSPIKQTKLGHSIALWHHNNFYKFNNSEHKLIKQIQTASYGFTQYLTTYHSQYRLTFTTIRQSLEYANDLDITIVHYHNAIFHNH